LAFLEGKMVGLSCSSLNDHSWNGGRLFQPVLFVQRLTIGSGRLTFLVRGNSPAIISGRSKTVIAHCETFARAGDLFLGNILNSMFHRNVGYRSYVHLITQARRLGMKREDEYRQLASDILQRASEEQSAVLRAQWEILSASYRELAGQSKKVEENDAQYDPIPWDRMRRH
jgi:hypothetical protein